MLRKFFSYLGRRGNVSIGFFVEKVIVDFYLGFGDFKIVFDIIWLCLEL